MAAYDGVGQLLFLVLTLSNAVKSLLQLQDIESSTLLAQKDMLLE